MHQKAQVSLVVYIEVSTKQGVRQEDFCTSKESFRSNHYSHITKERNETKKAMKGFELC